MSIGVLYSGLDRDNGKENGSYCSGFQGLGLRIILGFNVDP